MKTDDQINEMNSSNAILFEQIFLIRAFEEELLAQFQRRGLTGTTHTCIGQEAIPVAALAHCKAGDVVFSNHRSHGHFLAYGGSIDSLLHEIAGHREGVCKGLGGSQHLSFENFYSNGVLGGTIATAAGMALAEKLKGSGSIAFCFAGDGVFGEGIVYETLNLASLWDIPLLLIVEDNGYAQTTPSRLNRAGTLRSRIEAFGIRCAETTSNDVRQLHEEMAHAVELVRGEKHPFAQIVKTYRISPHSKGDDFREPEEMAIARERDPLRPVALAVGEAWARKFEQSAKAKVRNEFERVLHGAFKPLPVDAISTDNDLIPAGFFNESGFYQGEPLKSPRMLEHLNAVFRMLLRERNDVYLMGEDLLDPYGGAFKVYRGLSSQAPDRVLTTPISEAGIVGLANGMAIRGLRPIVEIMFGDFLCLAMDQLINNATKFPRMYGGQVKCPVVVRTPMGGRRGYGPTHSQSLEKHFLGVPGLAVVAASTLHDQKLIWRRIMQLGAPTLYLENKAQYAAEMRAFDGGKIGAFHATSTSSYFPTFCLELSSSAPADCAIVTYGGNVELALDAATDCFVRHEFNVRVIVVSQVAPLPTADLAIMLGECRNIVTLEEGSARLGFGAEVIAEILEFSGLSNAQFKRCAAMDTIIPNASEIENEILPQVQDVVSAVVSLVGKN